MIGFRHSGFLLLVLALCLALVATCSGESELPLLIRHATAVPTGDQPDAPVPPDRAVETATPSLPDKIRSLELAGYLGIASIRTFDLQGDLAYVGLGRSLEIIRLTDPAQPRRVGHALLPKAILDIAVSGDPSTGRVHAYVALGQGGLATVDVSDPADPVVVDTQFGGVHVSDVAVDQAHLYLSAGALHILDRSDPASPAPWSAYRPADAPGNAGKVIAIADGYAYVLYHGASGQDGGLRILELSEPAVPSLAGAYRAGVRVRDGAVSGGYAYLLVGEDVPYLVVLDVSDPSYPHAAGSDGVHTWSGQSLDVAGQTLYLVSNEPNDGTGTVQILDVTDPGHPVPLGRHDGLPAGVVEIAASGRQAVLVTGDSLVVIDVSESSAPAIAGRYDPQRLPPVRRGLAAAGDQIYIPAGLEGLWVADVSDPANPRVVGSLDTGGHAWSVALWDGHAYVAIEQGGLQVIDIHDPAHLVAVGVYVAPETSTFFSDVAIGVHSPSGKAYAYVADSLPGETSLRVVDISDPSDPKQVSRLPLGIGVQGDARAYGVAVAGEVAYLGVGAAGLRVVDVSDPGAPVEVGALSVPGRADNLVVADGRVYLVDGDLRIVDVSDPSSPREVGFYDVPGQSAWPHVAVAGRHAFLTALGTRVLDVSDPGAPVEVAGYPLGHGALAVAGEMIYVLGEELYVLRPSSEVAPLPAATSAPECTGYAAELNLGVTDTQPTVGDVVTVTATLINQGCGMLGLPRYSLQVETDGGEPIFAAIPESVVHSVGIVSGQSDVVAFPLRAVGTGQATLTAGVSFEFHAGYPGPAYWAVASGGPLQISVRPPD